MWHILTSDMMTECAEAAERAVVGGKPPLVLTDRWKGMRPEQLSAIHREQEEQRLERQVLDSLQNINTDTVLSSHGQATSYILLQAILVICFLQNLDFQG